MSRYESRHCLKHFNPGAFFRQGSLQSAFQISLRQQFGKRFQAGGHTTNVSSIVLRLKLFVM